MEACSPIELLSNGGHVFQWGLFFDGQRFILLWDEAVKEEFPDPHPFSLHERDRQCPLGSTQHWHRWCWGLLAWGPWAWGLLAWAHGPAVCLPMLGRPPEGAGSPSVRGASGGGRLQLVKSGRGRPSGGEDASCSGTSAVAVPGVVGPPVEATTPCPGIRSII